MARTKSPLPELARMASYAAFGQRVLEIAQAMGLKLPRKARAANKRKTRAPKAAKPSKQARLARREAAATSPENDD